MVRGDPRVVSCAVHSGDDGDRVIVLYFAGDDPDDRGQVKWCSACGAFNCDGAWRDDGTDPRSARGRRSSRWPWRLDAAVRTV